MFSIMIIKIIVFLFSLGAKVWKWGEQVIGDSAVVGSREGLFFASEARSDSSEVGHSKGGLTMSS